LLVAGCSQQSSEKKADVSVTQNKAVSFVSRENKPYLSQKQAEQRSNRVSEVRYQLDFVLTGKESFDAVTDISFQLNDPSKPLTLDLNKAKINSIRVNGKNSEIDYNQSFITLPATELLKGVNQVSISYNRLHSTNGEGLHRFVDSTDNRVYLYSHFEPAAANQMFALFDQPDLKATYQLTVTAPKDWTVISATKESNVEPNQGLNIWHFPESKKLSPYNFSLHAGPYKSWSDNSGKYPMRLFARQSIAKKIDPKLWFKYTADGLTFFDQYFGIDYPFEKYDQVLVPDFLYGAMENAAAITFAERGFVSSGEKTTSQKQRLASTIMHEMAHQWFGDLVTMKWWNGLWLNESFASFMGTLATAEATEFDYAWRSFYAFSKQYAYSKDQKVTTHPIEVPVPTTANAFDNIDAITYSKGASTLMQLRHLLGPKVFQKGVQNYLNKYAYQNAELDDFIGSLAETAGRDLSEWKQQWLYQPGVNTIKAQFSCQNNKITNLTLSQSANKNYPVLREQKVQLGLFSLKQQGIELNKAIAVTYKGAITHVKEAIGASCPDLLYPNYQDWGFVKVNLDQKSFMTAKNHLNSVSDPLLRSMLYQSLWDSARDADLSLNEYLEVAIKNIASEKDYTILGQAMGGIDRAMHYLRILGDKASSFQQATQPKVEMLYWENALNSSQDSNMQKRWFARFVSNASSQDALSKLNKLLSGKIEIEGIEINQEIRWNIIYQLNRYDFNSSRSLIDKELIEDSGDSGQKSAIAAQVIRPDAQTKKEWLAKIHQPKSELPFSKIRKAMGNLYPDEQYQLIEQTADEILAGLAGIDAKNNAVFMRSYANSLLPATCSETSVKRLAKAIEDNQNSSNITKIALLETHEEDERCLMIGRKLLGK